MSQFNDLLMPKLGLTMTEGTVMEWAVAVGDPVRAGELLFVVETEKVASEVSAEADGVMGEIVVQPGETVPVGTVVGRWTGPGQAGSATQPAQEGASPVPQDSAEKSTAVQQQAARQPDVGGQASDTAASRIVATPLARRLARGCALDLAQVGGTGPGGRIKAADVRRTQAQVQAGSPAQASSQSQAATELSVQTSQATPAAAGVDGGQRVATSGLVQSMARRLTKAKQVPHFYLSAEAEVSELLSMRERLNAMPDAPKLTLNHFLIAAVARALDDLPYQNRIWQDDHILQFDSIDVGVAVSTERGLLAPVLHGLAGASLDDIAVRSSSLIARIKDGKGTHSDMNGGAITISNAGMFNVTYMASIINPPQSAILGVGSIRELFRPDLNGAPALRREMGLVLSADHRLHDGTSALKFLNRVIELLQEPYRLLRNRTHIEG